MFRYINLRYIIQRILIGAGIILLVSFVQSCDVNAEEISVTCSNGTCSRYNGTNITSSIKDDSYVNLSTYMARGLAVSPNNSYAWFNLISEKTNFDYSKIYDINFTLIGGTLTQYIDIIKVNNISCTFNKPNSTSLLLGVNCQNVPGKYNNLNLFRVDISFSYPSSGAGGTSVLGFSKIWSFVQTTNSLQEETNNKLNDVNDSVNDLNDTMTDSSTDNNNVSNTINGIEIGNKGVITNLITMPITFFQSVLNNIEGSCTTFNLGNLFGTDLTMPCINIKNYVGSNLWNIIDILFSGFFILYVSKKIVKVFESFTNLKEGDVLDD